MNDDLSESISSFLEGTFVRPSVNLCVNVKDLDLNLNLQTTMTASSPSLECDVVVFDGGGGCLAKNTTVAATEFEQ